MTFDLPSTLFFLVYIGVTTVYGLYMKRVGVLQGINDTLISLSDCQSDLVKDAMKTLEDRAERHFRGSK